MKKVITGMGVLFVDMHCVEHDALVTEVHGESRELEGGGECHPAINLLYVTSDEDKRDSWGQQIKREASVVYSANQSAHGNCWIFKPE